MHFRHTQLVVLVLCSFTDTSHMQNTPALHSPSLRRHACVHHPWQFFLYLPSTNEHDKYIHLTLSECAVLLPPSVATLVSNQPPNRDVLTHYNILKAASNDNSEVTMFTQLQLQQQRKM